MSEPSQTTLIRPVIFCDLLKYKKEKKMNAKRIGISDADSDLFAIKVKKSEMKIDQLPIEMLMKIFNYLPACYDEVPLVNKLFYSVACNVNDPHIVLRIDESFFVRIFFFCSSNLFPSNQDSKSEIYSNRSVIGCRA